MASPDSAAQELAIPFRVYGLEGAVKTQDAAINRLRDASGRHSEALGAQAVTIAKHDEQLTAAQDATAEVKVDVARLAASVESLADRIAASTNRVAWTLTGFALTVAGSALLLVVTGTVPSA